MTEWRHGTKIRMALVMYLMLASMAVVAAGKPGAVETPINQTILAEINRVRTKPVRLVTQLEEYRSHFQGKELRAPGEVTLLTKEGAAAVDEAINFLKNAPALPAVRLSAGMSRAAADHVNDLGPRGAVGHYGRDGSSPSDRLSRYGAWKKSIGENISFGEQVARRVVMQLLIDDGVPDRGHRKNFFKAEFRVVGIACGKHTIYRQVCVIDFADDYREQ
jgi:uncharacterized protein YkwD